MNISKILSAFFLMVSVVCFGQSEVEPNNTFGQANVRSLVNLKDVVKGTISAVGDQDYFKFTIPRAGVITGSVIDVPTNINMQMILFDANQNKISESNYYVNPGVSANYEQLVSAAGTYYILLHDAGDNGSNSNQYTFTLGLDTTDIYEWNQDFATASQISYQKTLKGSIRDVGDQDYFKFTIPRPGVITGSVIDVSTNINMQMTLFDVNQNKISETDYYVNPGVSVNYEQLVSAAGTYYMRLHDAGDNGANANQYTFTLGLDTTDIYEWNQDFATASPISYQKTLKGSIRSIGDQDYFKFTIPRPGVITGAATNVPTNINLQMTLFDVNQNKISETNYYVNAGVNVNYEQLVSVAGTYYIRLHDAGDNGSNSNQYTFALGLDTTDVYEWNQDFAFASPIHYQTTLKASIRSENDQDYFKFTIPRAGVITGTVINVPTNINMQMTLFDVNQNIVSETNYYVNAGVNVNYEQLVRAGTYYMRLRDAGDNGSNSNQYTFTLGLDTTDVYEWNQDFGTASPITKNLCATIRSTGDIDMYSIQLSRTGTYDFSIKPPSCIAMYVRLYNANQVNVKEAANSNRGGLVALSYAVTTPGLYYLQLFSYYSGESCAQTYCLTLPGSITASKDISADMPIRVFPNPTNEHLTINTEGSIQTLHITNLTGKTVFLQKAVNEKQAEIDVSTLPKGIYFVNLTTSEGKQTTKKFIKN